MRRWRWFGLVLMLSWACTSPSEPRSRRVEGVVPLDGVVPRIPLGPGQQFPLLACYVSADGEHWWAVARWPQGGLPVCYLVKAEVALENVPPGWRYVVVIQ